MSVFVNPHSSDGHRRVAETGEILRVLVGSGVHGTYFWIDPAESLIGILLTCAPEVRRHYRALMRQLTYQALAD